MTLWASTACMLRDGVRLLRLLRTPAPRVLAWLAVGAAIEAVASVVLPYATKQIVDAIALASGELAVPLLWILVEAGVVAAQAVAQSLTRYQTHIIEVCAGPFLIERVLEKTSRIAYGNLETPRFLDRLTRARQDASHYGITYALQMITVGRWLLVSIGCLGLLVWIAPPWTVPLVMATAVLPLVLGIARARASFAVEHENLHRNRQAWYLEWLLSASEAAKEIRATGVGAWLVGLHARTHAPFIGSQIEIARRYYLRSWIATAVTSALVYGPYAYFIVATVRGRYTLGELLLFVLAFRNATTALAQLATAFSTAFEYHYYVDNLLDVLAHPEDALDRDPAPREERLLADAPELELEDVWFRYQGATRPVLRGLSLRVRAGETLAIIGRNGIGKTTLVKLLLGLYPLERGRIRIGGFDAAERSEGWRRDNVGIVFQDFLRYHFSARWNIGLGWSPVCDDDGEVRRAVAMAEAEPILERLPAGLDAPLGPTFGGGELSGGQWQRIALARLFMRRSRLWILDEPTSTMDPETEERTVRCFRQWTQGRTAILITHRLSTARIADRIAVVDDGRVTELGTHDELIAAGGHYARLFQLQARAYAGE